MNNVKRSRGEFFSADLAVLDRLANHGATAHEISAALVLMRGVSGRSKILATAYGTQSVCVRLGIGYPKAQKLLNLLATDQCPGGPIIDSMMDHKISKCAGSKAYRWRFKDPMDDPNPIYLPNLLVDGEKEVTPDGIPPLLRVLRIGSEPARLDALRLMLHGYAHHDLDDSGGIDPRTAFYQACVPAEDSLERTDTAMGGGITLHEFKRADIQVADCFLQTTFSHIKEAEDRRKRFTKALGSLLDAQCGILYPVTTIWDGPLHERASELQYTLYIHDFHEAKTQPTLQRQVHNLAFYLGGLDRNMEFFQERRDENIVGSGRHRYIDSEDEPRHPLTVFRLRFRPNTRDTGSGMARERERHERALKELEQFRLYAEDDTDAREAAFLDDEQPI